MSIFDPLAGVGKALKKGVDVGEKVIQKGVDVGEKVIQKGVDLAERVLGGTDLPDVREEGLTGAEIYRLFATGDTGSLRDAAEDWRRIRERYDDARAAVTTAMRSVWPDWEGEAAMAARGAIAPLERSLAATRDVAQRISETIDAQADWFDHTRRKVHKLAAEPPFDPNPVQAALLRDLERAANEYHDKADANRQFYREYVQATRNNLEALPPFEPAPTISGGGHVAAGSTGTPSEAAGRTPAVPTSPARARAPHQQPGPSSPAATSSAGWRGTTDFEAPSAPGQLGATTPSGDSVRPAAASFGAGHQGFAAADSRRRPVLGAPSRVGQVARVPSSTVGPRPIASVARPPRGGSGGSAGVTGVPGGMMPGTAGTRPGADERRDRRLRVPGPDRWALFGPDENVPPGIIGAPRGQA